MKIAYGSRRTYYYGPNPPQGYLVSKPYTFLKNHFGVGT